MTAKRTPRVLIIGAGGIGGMVAELIIPALNKIELNCSIEIMDGDIVEESNLGHQRFSYKDVGKRKTDVLSNRFSEFKFVNVKSNPVNVSSSDCSGNLATRRFVVWRHHGNKSRV